MSLINRMLQDLEQRRSTSGEGSALAGVRAVASQDRERRNGWWLALLVVLLGVIAVLLWLLQQRAPEQPSPLAPPQNLISLRLADVPALPPAAEKKNGVRPAANLERESDTPVETTVPASPVGEVNGIEENRLQTGRIETVKVESPVKKGGATGLAPVKQISPKQQAEFSYQKAVALLQQGRVAEAQESLAEAIRAAPDYVPSRQALAGILVEQKQYGQAEQLLREGLARAGNQPEFVMALARIQVERGEGQGALETLQKYQQGASDHAGYQAFLAALLQRQGQHKQAIEHYLTALRLAPASASSLVGLGISLQAENHPTEAQEAFSRAKASGGLTPELQNFVEQRLKQLQQMPR